MRMGLGRRARAELELLGLRLARDTAPERLWLLAVLYDRAGQWHLSTAVPRRYARSFALAYPAGEMRARWELAYPRAFADLLEQAARGHGFPWALFAAIVREESAFDPFVESWAHAVGLSQLILPTARRFSGGLPVSRATLRDPRTNLTIGGRFIGFLWQLFDGNPALVVPSYNAGQGATLRWLKKGPRRVPLDEFIERIPYDETRRYTKRVLSSYGAYHYLYAAARQPVDRFVALPPYAVRPRGR
jgi:soluble lytic murein transglycosylase